MTKEVLIKRTMGTLSRLPREKVSEVSDFADYMLKKYEEGILKKGIEKLVEGSKTFVFLKNEEDLYSIEDLKEKY